MSSSRKAAALVVALVMLTACSGGGGGKSTTTPTTTAPATSPPTTSPPTTKAPLHYVSLGDSYSAGGGLASALRPCGTAPAAYPPLVAQRTGAVAAERACNGATTADVLTQEQAPGVGRQIDAVTADADVVTISIGGNDIGFSNVMQQCAIGSVPCTTLEPQVTRDLAALPTKLSAVYGAIRQRAPHATLLVVGYPQLVVDPDRSALATCAGLTADESRWVREKGDQLAGVIRRAAEAAGGRYLDSAAAFAGHEACSPQPWMEGINFVNIAGSYHPNAAGQEQLARLVQAAFPNP